MAEKPKSGRKKTVRKVQVRIYEDEDKILNSILSKKKYSNMDESKLIRYAIHEFKKNNRFEATENFIPVFRLLVDATLNMSRTTANLNQIAHHLNSNKSVEAQELIKTINDLREYDREVFETVKELRDEVQTMANGIYYDPNI